MATVDLNGTTLSCAPRRNRKPDPLKPVKPGWRRAKATKTRNGKAHSGHPAFVPTASERRFVQAMAGLRISADEICKVIGAGRNAEGGIDEEDGGRRAIGKATLFKHFKPELANGRAMLKSAGCGQVLPCA
jgi:hypothetical protein